MALPTQTTGYPAEDPMAAQVKPTTLPNASQTGLPGQSTFTGSPGGNLINTQFNTDPSAATQKATGQTQTAKDAYGNYQFQGFTPQGQVNDTQSRNAFTGANDLAQQQKAYGYNPVAGTDLTGAQQYLSQAGANVGPSAAASGLMGMGQTGGFGYGGDTNSVRSQTQAQLGKVLNSTPDRNTLAQESLRLMEEQSNPAYQQSLRTVGQKAAALGRVGAGMTTNDLTGLAQSRENYLSQNRRQLANDAAGLTLSDATDRLNAARGVTSDFAGQDAQAGGLNLGYQKANNAERNNAFGRAQQVGSDTFNRNMAMSGQSANYAGIARNDALGERDAQRQASLDQNSALQSRASSLRNMGGDINGLDTAAWDRGVSERDKGLNYDQNMFRNRQAMFGDMAADEQRNIGNDRANTSQMQGERNYQYQLSQDAANNARQDRLIQEQLLNGNFNRGLQGFNAGYSQNPVGTMGSQAQSYANDANSSYGSAGDLFGQYGLNQPPTRRPTQNYNGSF